MKYQVIKVPVSRETFLFNGHDRQAIDVVHAERLEVVAAFARRKDAKEYAKANDSKRFFYAIQS